MKFEIKHRRTNSVLFSFECKSDDPKEAQREAVVEAVKKGANLRESDLGGAYMSEADLRGAYMSCAYLNGAILGSSDLRGADLNCVDLRDADLNGADLRGADLGGADLSHAYLGGANLDNADLGGANLRGVYLRDAKNISPDANITGEPWGEYLEKVVPALLTAGGKSLDEVLATGCWECHEWRNCPMHVAFGIDSPNQGPPLLVPRIQQFVQLFDARLIPKPEVGESLGITRGER